MAWWRTRKSSSGVLRTEDWVKCWPLIAVPMTVKMPEPTTAPMPSAMSEMGPRVLRSRRSGSSDSAMSLSMDFLAKSCDRVGLLKMGVKIGVYRLRRVLAK
jgi:hypothetical protein